MTTACVIAAVVVVFIACCAVIVALHEQRDNAAADWADEVFRNAVLKHKLKTATDDFDALLARHAELAAEHVECPIPLLPVADVDIPVHTDVPDDVWLELLVTRPADGPTS